jgi:hypothetical protein
MADRRKLCALLILTFDGARQHAWKIDNPAGILQRAGKRQKGKGVFS